MRPCSGLDPPRDQRTAAGPRHARVAVALQVVVDRPGAARGQVAAERSSRGSSPERGPGGIGHEHRRHRGDQEQRDDPRLGQRQVVAQHLRPRAPGGQRRGYRLRQLAGVGRALHRRQAVAAWVLGWPRRPRGSAGRRRARRAARPRRRRPSPRAASPASGGRRSAPDACRATRSSRRAGSAGRAVPGRAGREGIAPERRDHAPGAGAPPPSSPATAIAVRYMNSLWVSWMSTSRP